MTRFRTAAYTTLAELFVAAVFVADRAACVYLSVRNAVADEIARQDERVASALGGCDDMEEQHRIEALVAKHLARIRGGEDL